MNDQDLLGIQHDRLVECRRDAGTHGSSHRQADAAHQRQSNDQHNCQDLNK
jgi:hypothetical protein